jgi:hypothetical protein
MTGSPSDSVLTSTSPDRVNSQERSANTMSKGSGR